MLETIAYMFWFAIGDNSQKFIPEDDENIEDPEEEFEIDEEEI